MKVLGRLTSALLMITGGLCILMGFLSFFVSLFQLADNGLTLVILGGFVFGLGVGIYLLVQALVILDRMADHLEAVGSVARFLARKEKREEDAREVPAGAAYDAEHGVGLRRN